MIRATALALALPSAALANEDSFVDANLLTILYHELGHAVIDLMQVPIFGQEEDAADVMSVLLIDWLYEEEAAQAIAYDSAFGYLNDPDGDEEVTYWDVHGPDEQRYYNHICLFYGANPDERDDLAADLGLPEERAEYCPEEHALAAESWGRIFDQMADGAGEPIVFRAGQGADAAFINGLIAPEIEALQADLAFPETLTIQVAACDEANAFYDPVQVSITLCTEFIPHLRGLYKAFHGP